MSKQLPYFCWWVADAETDENFRAMTDEQVGFYLRCLDHTWINGSMPADPDEAALVMGRTRAKFDRLWERVGRCFVPRESDPSRLVNLRQEKERASAVKKSEKARASADARWMRTHSEGNARAYDSVSVSDFEFGSEGSAEGGAAAAFDLEAAWLEFHAVYHPKGRSRQIDARSYYLEKLITAGPLAESRHVEIMRLMRERWVPSDLWDRGFVTREDVFIQQESWTETPEPSARYAAQMSRRAAEDRKTQEFNQAFAAWQVDHPGGTREEYVDWQFEQEWGKEALLEMKAQEAKWDKSQAATA